MIESKGWKWEMVGDESDSVWKIPSKESYYLLNRWKQQKKSAFLDLGCGLGRHAMLFGKNGFYVSCFDISEDAVSRTRAWAESEEGLCFRYDIGDMLSLPYSDASVDCVLCRNVISHTDTEGVKRAISEIYRVLKNGGECYVTLASKSDWGYRQDWTAIDDNTKLRLEEGPEYGIPHFYADYELIFELFSKFEIINVEHIETFYEASVKTKSSFHYHVLCRKNG